MRVWIWNVLGVALIASSISFASQSIPNETIAAFAKSSQWQKLLHVRARFPFGNLRSEISEGNFFFSELGAKDPEAELRATLAAFAENRRVKNLRGQDQHARCAFPARWDVLRREFGASFPEPDCPELEDFLKKLDAQSLTLVFSSSYPNSPPSMFGHTFFRVNSGKGDSLSDFGINYAAFADGAEGGASFAISGVFGGYYGHFSIDPYFFKVNEYNHAESRDLWEYDLNLSRDEVRLVLMHVWELDQQALFRYYFFDENCSYRLLTLLEVARPEWKLSAFAVHVIPAETIKSVIKIDGAVKKIGFRPSIRRQMRFVFKNLTETQQEAALKYIRGDNGIEIESDAAVLDLLIEYYRYQTYRNDGKLSPEETKRQHAVLKFRSKLHVPPPKKAAESDLGFSEGRPDQGHGPTQWSVGGGMRSLAQETRGFGELGFKFAYHDLWNSDRGYTRYSQVEFPQLQLRFDSKTLWIEHLGIANVISLFPFSPLEKRLSWSAYADYGVPKDLGCWQCHTFSVGGAAGFALSLWDGEKSSLLFYTLGGIAMEGGSTLQGFARGGPNLKSAFLFEAAENLKLGLSALGQSDLFQASRQWAYLQLGGNLVIEVAREWEVRTQALSILPVDSNRGSSSKELRLGLYKTF